MAGRVEDEGSGTGVTAARYSASATMGRVQAPPPRRGDPIAFAHRGGASGPRENTLTAFVSALQQGAPGLESDAWITADDQVVLHHDGVTGPLWRRQPISTQNRAELPARVPALRDLYQRCGPDFELSLDVKDGAALPGILAESDRCGATARLWLCHGDWQWLAGWRAASPQVNLVHSARLAHIEPGFAAHAARLQAAGIDVLNMHRSDWNAERVATVHAAGIQAFGWDAQSHRQIGALLRMDVDGVYSDHVDRLLTALADQQKDQGRGPGGGPPPAAD